VVAVDPDWLDESQLEDLRRELVSMSEAALARTYETYRMACSLRKDAPQSKQLGCTDAFEHRGIASEPLITSVFYLNRDSSSIRYLKRLPNMHVRHDLQEVRSVVVRARSSYQRWNHRLPNKQIAALEV
jgi:hypothetical protein